MQKDTTQKADTAPHGFSKLEIDREIHLKEAKDIFRGKLHEYGPIEHPNKNGFLALAKKGKDTWNAWRDAYPEKDIELSHIDFTKESISFSNFVFMSNLRPWKNKAHRTNFAGSQFGKNTDFSNAEFSDITVFDGCTFESGPNFKKSIFGIHRDGKDDRPHGIASFNGCEFKDEANFSEAIFIFSCEFKNCVFGRRASFKKTQFTWESEFSNSNFGEMCNFRNAVFSNKSKFTGSIFEKNVDFSFCVFFGKSNFDGAIFEGSAKFIFAYFGKNASFFNCNFGAESKFDGTIFTGDSVFGASPDNSNSTTKNMNLTSISFCGAQFRSKVDFSGRNFLMKTDFGPTSFSVVLPDGYYRLWNKYRYVKDKRPVKFFGIANFHDCKFQQDTSFEKSEFHYWSTGDSARSYRTLKLVMEQMKATREEQRFFRLEMKAERKSLMGWRWFFSTLYEWLSDYGFSIWRPIICLLLASIMIGTTHGVLSNMATGVEWRAAITPHKSEIDSSRTHAMLQYVAISSLPIPGLDKTQQALREQLFKKNDNPKITTFALALEIAHKVISLCMVFLVGLALRNLFKMKS